MFDLAGDGSLTWEDIGASTDACGDTCAARYVAEFCKKQTRSCPMQGREQQRSEPIKPSAKNWIILK